MSVGGAAGLLGEARKHTHRNDNADHGCEDIWPHTSSFVTDLRSPVMSRYTHLFWGCCKIIKYANAPHAYRRADMSMFQNTDEVSHQVSHRSRRPGVSGMCGLSEATEIGDDEVVVIL